jgi:hypothetical protein
MQKIDDFLIDKIFQPIANLCYPFLSCYKLAYVLFILACISTCIGLSFDNWFIDFITMFLLLFWISWALRARNLDKTIREGMIPIDRSRDLTLRFVYFLLLIFTIIQAIISLIAHDYVVNKLAFQNLTENFGWILATIGLYFIACRKLPPIRRTGNVMSFFNSYQT